MTPKQLFPLKRWQKQNNKKRTTVSQMCTAFLKYIVKMSVLTCTKYYFPKFKISARGQF